MTGMNPEQTERAAKRLREASKQAAAAVEPLLRLSYRLETEDLDAPGDRRSGALAHLQKGLSANPIMAMLAREVLADIAPERIEASERGRAKREADRERVSLWRHMREHAKEHGMESVRKVMADIMELERRMKGHKPAPEPAGAGNVVSFPGA